MQLLDRIGGDLTLLAQKFEEAAEMRDKERKMIAKLNEAQDKWDNSEKSSRPQVTEDDVADIVAMVTGIPLAKVAESETENISIPLPAGNDLVVSVDFGKRLSYPCGIDMHDAHLAWTSPQQEGGQP